MTDYDRWKTFSGNPYESDELDTIELVKQKYQTVDELLAFLEWEDDLIDEVMEAHDCPKMYLHCTPFWDVLYNWIIEDFSDDLRDKYNRCYN